MKPEATDILWKALKKAAAEVLMHPEMIYEHIYSKIILMLYCLFNLIITALLQYIDRLSASREWEV